jgi:hypothetical protein
MKREAKERNEETKNRRPLVEDGRKRRASPHPSRYIRPSIHPSSRPEAIMSTFSPVQRWANYRKAIPNFGGAADRNRKEKRDKIKAYTMPPRPGYTLCVGWREGMKARNE